MYACLHVPEAASIVGSQQTLFLLARNFSPEVEETAADTVVFPIAPLRALLGSVQQIASEICRQGEALKLPAQLAVAAYPDTAILLARHYHGVTLVTPGEEAAKLAGIPLRTLFTHDMQVDLALLNIFHQWGLKTCQDLAALPENALAERFGMAGVYLRSLALGNRQRPLRIAAPESNYEERMELEHPLDILEPLLFLLASALSNLCQRLRCQSQAARLIEVRFSLENKEEYQCCLEFPVPLDESRSMLKLLQLHLERHSPQAAVVGFNVRAQAAEPRRVQGGLFMPPTPQPDKLQVTLARIAALVGDGNVGTPELLNTYRPDAFHLTTLNLSPFQPKPDDPRRRILRLSLRLFRPALPARVRVVDRMPKQIAASGVAGRVVNYSGPWETSGEWWALGAWHCAEWDVALDDGAFYRISCELNKNVWVVAGVYD
jgi:protein ImuB